MLADRLLNALLRLRRWPIQLASSLWMNSYFLATPLKAIPCWGMNCYACPASIFSCPIGTLQHFMIIRQPPLYVLGVIGTAGALGGRFACGWLCPFGFLQDLLFKLRTPKWRLRVGQAGLLRYAILLVLVVIIPYVTLEPWFSKLCPLGTLQGGIPWMFLQPEFREQIGWLYWLKIGILIAFITWMLVSKRPFCRYVCPLGAIWGLFNRASLLRLEVDRTRCQSCGRCQEVCPVDIAIYESENGDQCIRCLQCVQACPQQAVKMFATKQ